MPSENELANFFGTTRNSVRKVYETLEAMGYISSKQGLGHFPREKRPAIELALRGDVSFSEKMNQQNIPYRSLNVHCKLVDEGAGMNAYGKCAEKANSMKFADCASSMTCRLRCIIPMFRQRCSRTSRLKAGISDRCSAITTRKATATFTSSGSELSVSFPHSEEQELLECGELVPLLILESDCRDKASGRLLELTKIVYRSDRFSYKINV